MCLTLWKLIYSYPTLSWRQSHLEHMETHWCSCFKNNRQQAEFSPQSYNLSSTVQDKYVLCCSFYHLVLHLILSLITEYNISEIIVSWERQNQKRYYYIVPKPLCRILCLESLIMYWFTLIEDGGRRSSCILLALQYLLRHPKVTANTESYMKTSDWKKMFCSIITTDEYSATCSHNQKFLHTGKTYIIRN